MSQLTRSVLSSIAAGTLLVAVSTADADPTIRLLDDWGKTSAEVWLASGGEHRSQTRQGPVLQGVGLDLGHVVFDASGRPDEVAAIGRIGPANGPAGVQMLATVQPVGATETARGLAESEFAWRLAVGAEAVRFASQLWATGGAARLQLFDETAGQSLLDTGLYRGYGTSLDGTLLAGHIYTLQGLARVDATLGGDPFAGLEFATDAVFATVASVPEPITAGLLAVGLIVAGRRCRTMV